MGSEIRYHVISNFYLLGRAQLTTLDSNTRDSSTIENGTYGEIYLGIAFFNDKTKGKSTVTQSKTLYPCCTWLGNTIKHR